MDDAPKRIGHDKLSKIIDNYEQHAENGNQSLWGKYYLKDNDGIWMACDNSRGYCDIEEFSFEREAFSYLIGMDFDNSYGLMLQEEVREIAGNDLIESLRECISDNFAAYKNLHSQRNPHELLHHSLEALCVYEAYNHIMTPDEPLTVRMVDHLMQFKNPLRVVSENLLPVLSEHLDTIEPRAVLNGVLDKSEKDLGCYELADTEKQRKKSPKKTPER